LGKPFSNDLVLFFPLQMLLKKLIFIIAHIYKPFQLFLNFPISSIPFVDDLNFIVDFVQIIIFGSYTLLSTVGTYWFSKLIRIYLAIRYFLYLVPCFLNYAIQLEVSVSFAAQAFVYT